MRKVDPTILLIASGAMPDTMTGSKQSLNLGDKLIPEYLSPADWTGTLFQHCLDNMDLISEHFYYYGTHFDLARASRCPMPRTSRSSTGCAARPTTPRQVRGVPGVPRAHPRPEGEAGAHRLDE